MPTRSPILELTAAGLFCPVGGFHVDPWAPVERAIITHAHSDHARPGSASYLTAAEGVEVLRTRLPGASIEGVPHGEFRDLGGVRVSLHPAGHVLGSAQVRIEHRGEVWVVSGDYKLDPDPTTRSFEPVRCHVFVSECTFGLPVYRWGDPSREIARLRAWRRRCREQGRDAVIAAYSLGKAQRILASLAEDEGPILVHGAIRPMCEVYRSCGVRLPELLPATREVARSHRGRSLVIAPPSAIGGSWMRGFPDASRAAASGWMLVRGVRRRRGLEEGFVVSDHADFPGLERAIAATGCEVVLLTHGFVEPLAAHLRTRGLDARPLATRFGEDEEAAWRGAGTEPASDGTDVEEADLLAEPSAEVEP